MSARRAALLLPLTVLAASQDVVSYRQRVLNR